MNRHRRWIKALGYSVFCILLYCSAYGPLAAGAAWTLDQTAQEFLEPDQAFIFSTQTHNDQGISAHWDIVSGYYLYRDKFSFKVDETGWKIKEAPLPRGHKKEDPTFGDVEIYTGSVDIPLTFERSPDAALTATLSVTYQGCAEAGICYPPIEKSVPIELTAAGSKAAAAIVTPEESPGLTAKSTDAKDASEAESLADRIAADSLGWTVLSFIGFGLLLSFTPCVLPMIPILSGIIVGQGGDLGAGKAFSLSAVYVITMAFTYAIVGVTAALFGQNLQAVFQAPVVLTVFAFVFVLLACSMFGLFKLQLPSAWQTSISAASNKQKAGSLLGVAGMGFFSALIVGPCVAPPLAGALLYISKSGNVTLGGVALFSLGIGMGLPLLAVGTSAGRFVPRAGVWMEQVQVAFGVLLLGVAISLLERILAPHTALLLWGILFITAAIFLGALDALDAVATGGRRLAKALGIAVLVYGASLIVGGASGSNDVFQPLSNLLSGAPAARVPRLHYQTVKGTKELQLALNKAQSAGKSVMLDFYAEWCVECKQIEKHTLSRPEVRDALADWVLLQADVTANDSEDRKLLQSLNLYGPPALLFFDRNGAERRDLRLVGFVNADRVLQSSQLLQKS